MHLLRGSCASVALMIALASCTTTAGQVPAAAPTTSLPAATPAAPTTSSPASTPTPSKQWPAALAEQDFWYSSKEPTWAVYLATASSTEDQQGDVVARAKALGYDQVTWIPMGFHTSAEAVFGADAKRGTGGSATWTLVLFFADEISARTFAELWQSPVLGIASGWPAGDFG